MKVDVNQAKKFLERIEKTRDVTVQAAEKEYEDIIAQAGANYKDLADKLNLYIKLKGAKDKSSDRYYEQASSLLCYNDVCYCCQTKNAGGRECLTRSLFLDLIDMSDKKFEELKLEFSGFFREAFEKRR